MKLRLDLSGNRRIEIYFMEKIPWPLYNYCVMANNGISGVIFDCTDTVSPAIIDDLIIGEVEDEKAKEVLDNVLSFFKKDFLISTSKWKSIKSKALRKDLEKLKLDEFFVEYGVLGSPSLRLLYLRNKKRRLPTR